MKLYSVYIVTNRPRGVLYTGFSGYLSTRILQHKGKQIEGFTKRYNLTRLVYFEEYTDPRMGIAREKEIKGWRRAKKIALIEKMNPDWKDLARDWRW